MESATNTDSSSMAFGYGAAPPPEPSAYERSMHMLSSDVGQDLAARLDDTSAARLALLLDVYEAQIEGAWCGLAVTATALKVLAVLAERPRTPTATQHQLFEQALVVTRAQTRRLPAGISMAELEVLVDAHTPAFGARVRRVDGGGDATLLASALDADLNDTVGAAPPLILVNLIRHVKGQTTGHWMLIGGSVQTAPGERWILMLDPAAHKLGPHWLPELLLVSAMATLNSRGEPRGYLAVDTEVSSRAAAATQTHRHSVAPSSQHADGLHTASRERQRSDRDDDGGWMV